MRKFFIFLIIFCLVPTISLAAPTYADLVGHWSEGYINSAADMGLISVSSNDNFSPDSPVTLAELLSMLVPMVNGKSFDISLSDEDWHREYVDEAFTLGIMNGFTREETEYFYDTPVMRMMANVLFSNTLKCLDIADKYYVDENTVEKSVLGLIPFSDAAEILGDLYTVATYHCVAHEIIEGDDSSLILPYDYLTRAQAITVLVRIKRLQIRITNGIEFIDPFSYHDYSYTCISDGEKVYPIKGAGKSAVYKGETLYTSVSNAKKILEIASGGYNTFATTGIYQYEAEEKTSVYKIHISEGSVPGSKSYAGYISGEMGKKYVFDFSKGKSVGMFIGSEPMIPLESVLNHFSYTPAEIIKDNSNGSVIIRFS